MGICKLLISGGRNTLQARRTATRLNMSRPQVRWVDGVEIARVASQSRVLAARGNNAITIGTIISEALAHARDFAQVFHDLDT